MASLLKRLFSRLPMARSTRAYDFGLERLDLPPAPRLLDIGAGQGFSSAYLSRRLPAATVLSVDVTLECLKPERLETGPRPPLFIQATAPRLPLADGCLDAVLLVMTFHCLPEPEQVMAEVGRVLRPGGALLLADVDGDHWMARPFEWVEHRGISPLTHAYTVDELRRLVRSAGLSEPTVHRRPGKERGFMLWLVARKDERPETAGRSE